MPSMRRRKGGRDDGRNSAISSAFVFSVCARRGRVAAAESLGRGVGAVAEAETSEDEGVTEVGADVVEGAVAMDPEADTVEGVVRGVADVDAHESKDPGAARRGATMGMCTSWIPCQITILRYRTLPFSCKLAKSLSVDDVALFARRLALMFVC